MRKRPGWLRRAGPVVLLALALAAASLPVADAATPGGGELSRSRRSVSWKGRPGVPLPRTYTACAGGNSPACDYFTLRTRLANRTPVAVSLAYNRRDTYEVFVFRDHALVASAVPERRGSTKLVFETSRGATYRIAVQPASSARYGYRGTATVAGPRSPATSTAFDEEIPCLEPVPEGTAAALVEPEDVRVLVVVDGVSRKRAGAVFRVVREYYNDIGIGLRLSYGRVSLKGTDPYKLLAQTKERIGGIRPRRVDLVYVLTNKDLTFNGNTGVAGLADCIGGVRYGHRAFAIGEDFEFENRRFFALGLARDATARIAAHELGHLLGAHHHYANCAQAARALADADATPCTIMFNDLTFVGASFSTASTAVIRSHTAYAAD